MNMDVTIHLYIAQIPILNAIIRAFNSYGKPPNLHNLYFVACTHICTLLLPEQWKCFKELTQNFKFHFFFFFFFWPHHAACRIFVPRPEVEPRTLAVKAQNPNHWTTSEVPKFHFLIHTLSTSGLLRVRKGEGTLPFLLCHHFQSRWLMQSSNTNKNGYKRVLWLSVFLRWNCLLSEFKANSGSNGKCCFLGLLAP